MEKDASSRLTPRLILGLGIVALGVLFTLDNLGFLEAGEFLEYWPVLLVAVGISKLTGPLHSRAWLAASFWILIGSWLLLYNLEFIELSLFDLWPVLLILLGVAIVGRALYRPRADRQAVNGASTITTVAVLCGSAPKNSSKDFRGGDLTAIMGGCDVDLRHAQISGTEAVLDVFAFMGGIEIRVPPEWTVTSKVTPLLGTLEDKTDPPPDTSPEQRLTVRGYAVLGGVEVRN